MIRACCILLGWECCIQEVCWQLAFDAVCWRISEDSQSVVPGKVYVADVGWNKWSSWAGLCVPTLSRTPSVNQGLLFMQNLWLCVLCCFSITYATSAARLSFQWWTRLLTWSGVIQPWTVVQTTPFPPASWWPWYCGQQRVVLTTVFSIHAPKNIGLSEVYLLIHMCSTTRIGMITGLFWFCDTYFHNKLVCLFCLHLADRTMQC